MRTLAKNFQDLIVWQKVHAFVLGVYAATQLFPKTETYGMMSQFRRAAVLILVNIAEGFRKYSEADNGCLIAIALPF